jgi:signal transduction histidine kinase
MKLNLEALRARLGQTPTLEDLRAEVSRVVAPLVQALDGAIADTRNLMSDLRPPLLAERGLAAALGHEVERQRRHGDGLQLSFVHHGAPALAQRDLALEYALFMIGQAALNNALQHAQAHHVTLDLDESPGRVQLSLRDDGRGFDGAAPPPLGHLGLVGMQERARWIGAALTIDSLPGLGTTVTVLWHAQPTPPPLPTQTAV